MIETRHAREIGTKEPLGEQYDLAVVIDVVRAFTTAPWVLRRGAARLFLAPDAQTALAARKRRLPEALLMKDGHADPRFPLPNAPGEVAELDLGGATVIQTTGNGTRGAHLVRGVPVVACASFTTASATVRLARQFSRVLLLPTEGDEDHALADLITARLTGQPVHIDRLLGRVRRSAAGVECRHRGFDPDFPGVHPRDLELCLQVDAFDRALVVEPDGDLLRVVEG